MAWWQRLFRIKPKELRLDVGAPLNPGKALATSPQLRQDEGGFENLVTGLGVTGVDPRMATSIRRPANAEINEDQANVLVRYEYGCQKHVVDLPNSALRKWIKIQIEGVKRDAGKRVLDKFEELELKKHMRKAGVFERQYGGALMLLGVDDGRSLDQPLELENIRTFDFVHVFSKYRIMTPSDADLDRDPQSPRFGLPKFYRLVDNSAGVPQALDQKIHHTRCIVFPGWAPEERKRRYDWGVSVLENFWPTWRDYKSSLGSCVALAHRAEETRLGIKGLTALKLAKKWQAIKEQMNEIHIVRAVLRIFLHDADDVVTDHAIDFSGAATVVQLARDDVAGAAGLSQQAFFGLTREGLSDRDEGASERDDAAVAAYQEETFLKPLNRCTEIALAVLRLRVKTWQVTFVPLREETPDAMANRRQTESQTAHTYIGDRVIDRTEVREALRADVDSPYQLQPGDVPEPEPAPVLPGQQRGNGAVPNPTNGAIPRAGVANEPQ